MIITTTAYLVDQDKEICREYNERSREKVNGELCSWNPRPKSSRGPAALRLPSPKSQQKTKLHSSWLNSGFSFHIFSYKTNVFHSEKRDRNIVFPNEPSSALPSVLTGKSLLVSQSLQSFSLGLLR